MTPALVAGVTVALALSSIGLAVASGVPASDLLGQNEASTWVVGLGFGLVGAAVLRDGSGNRLGPLMSAAGLLASLSVAAYGYAALALRDGLPLLTPAVWVTTVLWLPALLALILAVPLLFPDGALPSPRWRWPAGIGSAAATLAFLSVATTQEAFDSSGFAGVRNPLDLPVPDDPQLVVGVGALLVCIAVALSATVAILLRMRHLDRPIRVRHAWFAAAILIGLASLLPVPPAGSLVLNLLSVWALGVGVVRHRLFDIEPVLSRAVVYLILTGAAVAVYLLAATVVGARASAALLPAVLTAIAALLLARGQAHVQSFVQRWLYGDRGDPQTALSRLGERLAGAVSTDEVLPATVAAVRSGLRLPYAAVLLTDEDLPACAEGERPERTARFPLSHAGEDVGTLVVGVRAGEHELSGADVHVLSGFAQQAAVAAHGVRTTRELRRSHEQIVTAREEERARIHRDLHDGLAPALAGISLGLETAGRVVARQDTDAAGRLLSTLGTQAASCVDDVRRIVADLRPPVLDEVGLVGALRRQAELLTAHSGDRLRVSVEVPGGAALPKLPSAVEVAAYRIASEATANSARHSGAGACRICVECRGSALTVCVEDDGSGTPPAAPGTGLHSMRARAEELGGTCTVTFSPGLGTRVLAVLPVRSTVAS